VGALTACDVQPNGHYEGETMLALHGTITNQLATPPDGVELALWWYASGSSSGPPAELPPGFVLFSPEPVNGTFPSDFELDVMIPPPPEDIFNFVMPADHGDPMAFGQIAAIDPNTNMVLGVVLHHVVVYLPAPSQHIGLVTQPGMPAGYHLIEHTLVCDTLHGWQEVGPATTHLSLELGGPLSTSCPP
jgi:hypothetical protein